MKKLLIHFSAAALVLAPMNFGTTEKPSSSPVLVETVLEEKAAPLVEAPLQQVELTASYRFIDFKEKEKYTLHHTSSCGGGCNGGCQIFRKERTAYVYLDSIRYITCCGLMVTEMEHIEPTLRDNPMPDMTPPQWEVNAYPNPFSYQATVAITGMDQEGYQFEMFDLSGKRVMYRPQEHDAQLLIDRGSLSPGVYIYRIISETQTNVHNGKLIVQ